MAEQTQCSRCGCWRSEEKIDAKQLREALDEAAAEVGARQDEVRYLKRENKWLREALEHVLDGWTANIDTDNPTNFENALGRARAALDREGEVPDSPKIRAEIIEQLDREGEGRPKDKPRAEYEAGGLHPSVLPGGSLAPERITEHLRNGGRVALDREGDPYRMNPPAQYPRTHEVTFRVRGEGYRCPICGTTDPWHLDQEGEE
jgi:hypothetical protein